MVNIFNIFKRKPKDPEVLWAELQETIAPYKKTAWVVETTDAESSYLFSKFSGKAALSVNEAWPACPDSDEPMHLLVQLNSKQLPDESASPFGQGILQVFYCDERGLQASQDNPFENNVLVRLLDPATQYLTTISSLPHAKQYVEKQITGWTAVDDFPSAEQLKALGCELDAEQAQLLSDKGYPIAQDKLLGWPTLSKSVNANLPESTELAKNVILEITALNNSQREFVNNVTLHIAKNSSSDSGFSAF